MVSLGIGKRILRKGIYSTKEKGGLAHNYNSLHVDSYIRGFASLHFHKMRVTLFLMNLKLYYDKEASILLVLVHAFFVE